MGFSFNSRVNDHIYTIWVNMCHEEPPVRLKEQLTFEELNFEDIHKKYILPFLFFSFESFEWLPVVITHAAIYRMRMDDLCQKLP